MIYTLVSFCLPRNLTTNIAEFDVAILASNYHLCFAKDWLFSQGYLNTFKLITIEMQQNQIWEFKLSYTSSLLMFNR